MPSHYDIRENPACPDGMEHLMPDGTWMCGETHTEQLNEGGILEGPSHEEGGIPAIVGGSEPVELEGGEYIINAQTVDAVGTEFLDELNSTQTSYHQGGFNEGELPPPSQYAKGGRIPKPKGRTKPVPTKRSGGSVTPKKMAHGGTHRTSCPPGSTLVNGNCVPTNMTNSYQKGGKVNKKSTKKYQIGGVVTPGGKTNQTTERQITNRRSMSSVMEGTVIAGLTDATAPKKTSMDAGHTHRYIQNKKTQDGWTDMVDDHKHKIIRGKIQNAKSSKGLLHTHRK